MVFEGELDGRPVAVKRLLRQFYDLARKEIGALVLSDEHPNIVRLAAPTLLGGGAWAAGHSFV